VKRINPPHDRYSKPQVSWDIRSYTLYRGAEELMPGAYSTDLRERVLVAVEAGEPADAVAEEFMVGRSSVYRWMAAAHDEGRRAPKPMGRGPKPIICDETEVALCRLLEADNHLTLEECRDRLAAETGVRVNPWTIGRALRRLDWT
jgi:transposase